MSTEFISYKKAVELQNVAFTTRSKEIIPRINVCIHNSAIAGYDGCQLNFNPLEMIINPAGIADIVEILCTAGYNISDYDENSITIEWGVGCRYMSFNLDKVKWRSS